MIRCQGLFGFVWVCVAACSGKSAPEDLTSPLDFQLPIGDEVQGEYKKLEDGRVTAGTVFEKRAAPGPLPGTGELVERAEGGLTLDHPKWGRSLIHGVSFFRLNAQVEESLGYRALEMNGRPFDDLKLYELPYVDLKAPLVTGARWEFSHIRTADHPQRVPTKYHYAKRVLARELTLDLPAGRFERCIRFEVAGYSEVTVPVTCGGRPENRQVLKHSTEYYCPRVGMVRELEETRHGEPGRPDPACPTKRTEYTATRLIRAATPATK